MQESRIGLLLAVTIGFASESRLRQITLAETRASPFGRTTLAETNASYIPGVKSTTSGFLASGSFGSYTY